MHTRARANGERSLIYGSLLRGKGNGPPTSKTQYTEVQISGNNVITKRFTYIRSNVQDLHVHITPLLYKCQMVQTRKINEVLRCMIVVDILFLLYITSIESLGTPDDLNMSSLQHTEVQACRYNSGWSLIQKLVTALNRNVESFHARVALIIRRNVSVRYCEFRIAEFICSLRVHVFARYCPDGKCTFLFTVGTRVTHVYNSDDLKTVRHFFFPFTRCAHRFGRVIKKKVNVTEIIILKSEVNVYFNRFRRILSSYNFNRVGTT
jgi:hypothetical protein